MTHALDQRLDRIVGKRSATALESLGLITVGDLLRHYPRRVEDFTKLTDLKTLTEGDHVAFFGEVVSTTVRQMRARSGAILTATITDGRNTIGLTFFAGRASVLRGHESRLAPGVRGVFAGALSTYRGAWQLAHPTYLLVGSDLDDDGAAQLEVGKPMPIYPASAKVQTWQIQRAVRTVFDPLTEADVPDPIPEEIRRENSLPSLFEALRFVHAPTTLGDWHRAAQRFRFEEAFVLQALLARRRSEVQAQEATSRPGCSGGLLDALDERLPFTLTDGQRAVGDEIAGDLNGSHPMNRLLQGEVGSGKTVVALRAMAQVVDSGGQAAMLAPTEVLATQHMRTLRNLLGPLGEAGMLGGSDVGTKLVLLTGAMPAAQRRTALLDIASGAAGIVVGTHALIQDEVQFADLGLVVVDEQHRFGVEQRDALRAKARSTPHLLVMSATPIPRSLAMMAFGDLDTSSLTDIPAGRQEVVTHLVRSSDTRWVDRMWQRAREEVDGGHRVFVVCPRISNDDPIEELPAPDSEVQRPPAAVLDVLDELRQLPTFDGVTCTVLHGRMSSDDKDRAMSDFIEGRAPVMIATTVIEVGVDVPTATMMAVLDADRFGMAQLHQLRGRIGRGKDPGLCLLSTQLSPPESEDEATWSDSERRLQALRATNDGFELARQDAVLRREGDLLGAAQSGRSSLRWLRVIEHGAIIDQARTAARALVETDPSLGTWPALADAIAELDPERAEFLARS